MFISIPWGDHAVQRQLTDSGCDSKRADATMLG
jgi:hypothetical protein